MPLRPPAGFIRPGYDPLKVPDAPTIGTATSASGTSASVTFTAPSNVGGGAITGYIATARRTSDGTTIGGTGSSSPVTITGLTADVAYTITVAAVNSFGPSASSAASNSVTPVDGILVEYLVVAGGGGGGTNHGGGGGAGGYRTATGLLVPFGTSTTVTVGAGGTASASSPYGINGGNSVFGSITSDGGGNGSNSVGTGEEAGGNGGSGGGTRSADSENVGLGTSGQGNNGGVGNSSNGSGGGGAGASGGTTDSGGAGGAGLASSISGSSTFYAGGGGGGRYSAGTGGGGAGGVGGGGGGGTDAVGTAGTANTGGGGGGGGYPVLSGGNGGSGVVIIRYSDTFPAATSTTGSPTITVAGGFRVYRWTGSGSITL